MFAYARLDAIFSALNGRGSVPAAALARDLGVTERTVRSDIAKLNDALDGHGARISSRRGAGYRLEVVDPPLWEAFAREAAAPGTATPGLPGAPGLESPRGRQRLMLYTLLQASEPVASEQLMDALCVGETALRDYTRRIRELVASYGLELTAGPREGLAVRGREVDKRRCFTACVLERNMGSYLAGFSPEEEYFFCGIDLVQLKRTLRAHLDHFGLCPDDFAEKNVLMHLALAILRVQGDFSVEAPDGCEMPLLGELFITETCDDVERACGVALDAAERAHLYLHCVSNAVLPAESDGGHDLQAGIDRLLEDIFQNYGFDLRRDEALRANLLDHLRFVLDSRELGVSKKNPLVNTIRTSYPLAFEIALSSAGRVFGAQPHPLTEDEAGYIALHIGAAIERGSSSDAERLRAVLVCGAGRSMSGMLEQRLGTLFGTRLEITKTMGCRAFLDEGPDGLGGAAMVITTQPLETCPVPCVLVGYGMDDRDTRAVSKMLNALAETAGGGLEGFFDARLFMRITEPAAKDELLALMCRRLSEAGAVHGDFLSAVLERERLAATDISSSVAIPHALFPGIERTQVAVALLERPVRWNAQAPRVRIVFLLAFKPGDKRDFERLFDLMLEVAHDDGLQRRILDARSYGDFLATLADR